MSELYTAKEIAEMYQIYDKTALKLAHQGVLKTERFGRNAIRFHLLEDESGVPIDRLYTADDMAEKLKLNKQTVYKLARQGELERIKLGNQIVRFK